MKMENGSNKELGIPSILSEVGIKKEKFEINLFKLNHNNNLLWFSLRYTIV